MDLSTATTEELRTELARRGFFTRNLWHKIDVTDRYECTEEQAMEVLNEAHKSEWIVGEVFEMISHLCEGKGYPEK